MLRRNTIDPFPVWQEFGSQECPARVGLSDSLDDMNASDNSLA